MASLFQKTVAAFLRFPGVGKKSAERMVFHLFKTDDAEFRRFIGSITEFKKKIRICRTCGLMSEQDPCKICSSRSRKHSLICVVKDVQDALMIERSGGFKGVYHILGGLISPVNNIYEKDLAIKPLLKRIEQNASEIIFAVEETIEAEATLKVICSHIENKSIHISRLAVGIPTGTGLEYIDEITMKKAIENRQSTLLADS